MYRDIAKRTLEKLNEFNYKRSPDFGGNIEIEELIGVIVNECKSTVLQSSAYGNYMKRYESMLTKDSVTEIVRQLVRNGSYIPKEVMNKAVFNDGMFVGLDLDIPLYKGIDSEKVRKTAAVVTSYIDERDLSYNPKLFEKLNELYKNYGRELIFEDNARKDDKFLPKQNIFRIFKERLMHKKFTINDFEKSYADILREFSNCKNDEIIKKSAEYRTRYIYSKNFQKEVLSRIKNGTAIELLDKSNDDYSNLLNQIIAEVCELSQNVPNLNSVFKDIGQIYSDVEAQLEAYSTDIRGLSPKQIEEEIKRINDLSLKDDKRQYLNKDGYRNINVGFSMEDDRAKLLDREHVSEAMENLSIEISELVNNGDSISDEEYLKKASSLTYRFIRIHPFPDSNGRTSRALMNMMSLNRNILVNFPKETKNEYINAMEEVHHEIGYREDNGYLEALYNNPQKARTLEENGTNSIYNYIKKNSRKGIDSISSDDTEYVRRQEELMR